LDVDFFKYWLGMKFVYCVHLTPRALQWWFTSS